MEFSSITFQTKMSSYFQHFPTLYLMIFFFLLQDSQDSNGISSICKEIINIPINNPLLGHKHRKIRNPSTHLLIRCPFVEQVAVLPPVASSKFRSLLLPVQHRQCLQTESCLVKILALLWKWSRTKDPWQLCYTIKMPPFSSAVHNGLKTNLKNDLHIFWTQHSFPDSSSSSRYLLFAASVTYTVLISENHTYPLSSSELQFLVS